MQEYDGEGEALDPESGMSWSPSLAASWSVPLGTVLPFNRRKLSQSASVYKLLP